MDNCNNKADNGSCVGLTSNALPEAKNKNLADSSDTGVSTHCIHKKVKNPAKNPKEQQNLKKLQCIFPHQAVHFLPESFQMILITD